VVASLCVWRGCREILFELIKILILKKPGHSLFTSPGQRDFRPVYYRSFTYLPASFAYEDGTAHILPNDDID
jgi:hypothetical protein